MADISYTILSTTTVKTAIQIRATIAAQNDTLTFSSMESVSFFDGRKLSGFTALTTTIATNVVTITNTGSNYDIIAVVYGVFKT